MQLMGMLPFPLLERISLSASLHHNVSDATLPLLCHPHVRRLVLVGNFSDRGLSDALCPRLAAVGDGDVSWEVRTRLCSQESAAVMPFTDQKFSHRCVCLLSLLSTLTQDESCLSFTGCLDLEALVLSSPQLTPDVFRELACRVPSVKALKLSGCFDRRFLSQHVRHHLFLTFSWEGGGLRPSE